MGKLVNEFYWASALMLSITRFLIGGPPILVYFAGNFVSGNFSCNNLHIAGLGVIPNQI